jgi:predicted cupin superfamily sugar epimerase
VVVPGFDFADFELNDPSLTSQDTDKDDRNG